MLFQYSTTGSVKMAQPSTATYQDPTSKAFKDFGFVHQKDVFVATLTAGEHLTFMATLGLRAT